MVQSPHETAPIKRALSNGSNSRQEFSDADDHPDNPHARNDWHCLIAHKDWQATQHGTSHM